MPKEEKNAELVALTAKLDALTKIVETLVKPPEDEPAPKTDARDVSITRGTAFLKEFLAKDLTKEKLDAYTFNDLLVAAELKTSIMPNLNLNPAPPLSKEDAVDDPRPAWLRPTVN